MENPTWPHHIKRPSKSVVLDARHHLLLLATIAILVGIQTQLLRHQTALSAPLEPRLGIHDAIPPLRGLHQFRVLFFEDLEVALGFPVPDGVGGEDEVHFLEGALVGFGIEGPDDDDGDDVDGAEEVEGLFLQLGENGGEEEHLIVR